MEARQVQLQLRTHQEGGSAGSTGLAAAPSDDIMSTSSSSTCTSMSLINIFYCNITIWGKKAESFLAKETAELVCFVEHRLDKLEYLRVAKKFAGFKRSAFVSYAERLGAHSLSTSGGQIILAKSYLTVEPVDSELLKFCIPQEQQACPRWTGCVLRIKNVSILIITLYLRTSEGFSEFNASVLQQFFVLIACFRGAAIIGGDFQFPPSELISSPWLARLRLSVISPTGLEATCSSGSGRLIDYFLATSDIAPYVQSKPDISVPFKPHLGLRLSFPARLRANLVPTLRIPKSLPELPITEGEHQLDEEVWTRACDFTAGFLSRRAAHSGILGCSAEMLDLLPVDQRELSRAHCVACTKIEVYTALVGGVSEGDLPAYIGRGGFPHASLKPKVHRHALASDTPVQLATYGAS